ncbi:CP family cyanate transporter-like MFS transporter [Kribbella sp. VKM Ac-2527]|uniref:CP family cyanate transporter-like MFS transporter n=1 Tax=Kribbella caucasensis TaxID=2512215 RepID=A0A4R6KEM1_9ACTN|nr:MFS transporter [Kribbella sp. VKM Ac-2527]TDO46424.1 CP family cyanate transporter-like MFS transporter [Kribbella sp. VKM Ac-2527]
MIGFAARAAEGQLWIGQPTSSDSGDLGSLWQLVRPALNLRPALAGVSPLLADITRDLRLTPTTGGLITTVMVVCLGVASPLAPSLVRRWGVDSTLFAALVVLTIGILLRSGGSTIALYAGAAVAGSAIAVMNVVMPAVVKRYFPDRVGALTAVYVSGLVTGAALTAGLMVPVQRAFGDSWQTAAASIAALSAAAALTWLPRVRRPVPQPIGPTTPRPRSGLLRDRVVWSVTAFMGLQSLTFYVVLAWLPPIFRDAGLSAEHAGYLLALSNLSQLVSTLTVPTLAARARSQSGYAATAAVVTLAGYLGVLFAPSTASWLWAVLLGLGQGASIALALLFIALRSPDPLTTTSVSALAQSIGYVLAATGPVAVGLLRQATGGWTVPLIVIIGVLIAQLTAGILAGRPRLVTPR